jgi:hypothetical protein
MQKIVFQNVFFGDFLRFNDQKFTQKIAFRNSFWVIFYVLTTKNLYKKSRFATVFGSFSAFLDRAMPYLYIYTKKIHIFV